MAIETLLDWGAPATIHTDSGKKILRKAKPTDFFYRMWGDPGVQSYLKSNGISYNGCEVCLWADCIELNPETIQASRAITANVNIPKPDGLEYMEFQKAGIAFACRCFGFDL